MRVEGPVGRQDIPHLSSGPTDARMMGGHENPTGAYHKTDVFSHQRHSLNNEQQRKQFERDAQAGKNEGDEGYLSLEDARFKRSDGTYDQEAFLEAVKAAQEGDEILDPVTFDHGQPSLRPQFLVGGAETLRMAGEEKMKQDAMFDMFSWVPEGFSLGASNSMFLKEKAHEANIRYREPLFVPRAEDGPVGGLGESGMNEVKNAGDVNAELARVRRAVFAALNEYKRTRSVDSLPDDNNAQKSSKGLKAKGYGPLLPVIDTHSPFVPVREPAGVHMKRKFKSLFNTQNFPLRPREYNPNNGFPTLKKQKALEVVLP